MAASRPKPSLPVVDQPHAPVVYFEAAPVSSTVNGLGRITLSAELQLPEPGGQAVRTDPVAVAYLRSNLQGFRELRAAIDRLLLLAEPAETTAKN